MKREYSSVFPPARVNELNSADEIIIYCRSGVRSLTALKTLQDFGCKKLKNLRGGIIAWAEEIDKGMPVY